MCLNKVRSNRFSGQIWEVLRNSIQFGSIFKVHVMIRIIWVISILSMVCIPAWLSTLSGPFQWVSPKEYFISLWRPDTLRRVSVRSSNRGFGNNRTIATLFPLLLYLKEHQTPVSARRLPKRDHDLRGYQAPDGQFPIFRTLLLRHCDLTKSLAFCRRTVMVACAGG